MQLAALHDMLAEAQADDLHTLIASGRIYVDLHSAPLAEPQQVQLFPDQETASAYALVFKARDFDIGATAGEMPPQFAEADPADLREANRRHAMITQSITQLGVAVCHGRALLGGLFGFRPPRSIVGPMGSLAAVAAERRYSRQRSAMYPFVTLLEIHKLMYFMQEAGQPLPPRLSERSVRALFTEPAACAQRDRRAHDQWLRRCR